MPFLLDHPQLYPARPTDDVDVIVQIVSGTRFSEAEKRLRELGFDHDMTPNAPKCRWRLGKDLLVDVMPTDGQSLGLNTSWFTEALASASEQAVRGNVRVRLISAPAFLALALAPVDYGPRNVNVAVWSPTQI